MEEKFRELKGKRIDVNCGAGSMFRGLVENVDGEILVLKDEHDQITNVAMSKIIAFTECSEPVTRPGFVV